MYNDFFDPFLFDDHLKMAFQAHSFNYRVQSNGSKYIFRCNVCGDSTKDQRKMRGCIMKNKDPWMFNCLNCGVSMPADMWLREYFPNIYHDYVRRLLIGNKRIAAAKIEAKQAKSITSDTQDTLWFKPMIAFPESVDYCKKRMIPEHVYSTWYYADGGKYIGRIVIPFYDDKGRIYSYQGRTIDGGIPKYLGPAESNNEIYNWYKINKNDPVIILEGLIDSSLVVNSLAMAGLKIENPLFTELEHKFWLLDNDKAGWRDSALLLEKGQHIFMWKKFLIAKGLGNKQVKDVNDFVIEAKLDKLLTFDDMKHFFTNNLFDLIYL